MFVIDLNSNNPVYLEIVNGIIKLIINGTYKPQDKLPSIRALSKTLSINHNTVQRAYLELEHRGFIYSKAGKGMFVKDNINELTEYEQTKLVEQFNEKVEVLKDLGYNEQQIIKLVQANF